MPDNGFSSFSQKHHYASGIILVTVGVVGFVACITGTLASALAALWVPSILETASGGGATLASSNLGVGNGDAANQIANTIQEINPITGPVIWAEKGIEELIP